MQTLKTECRPPSLVDCGRLPFRSSGFDNQQGYGRTAQGFTSDTRRPSRAAAVSARMRRTVSRDCSAVTTGSAASPAAARAKWAISSW
jgi:hypothetical protein